MDAKKVKILVVEDSPTQAIKLQRLLESQGYKVVTAGNGKKGIDAAQKHKPDLIISDVNMPEMNGFEMCAEIKKDDTLAGIPFVILTQLVYPEDIINGLKAGADYYLTKPYHDEFLATRIKTFLKIHKELDGNDSNIEERLSIGWTDLLLKADKKQILTLLLSTYDGAAHMSSELNEQKRELKTLNDQLEDLLKSANEALSNSEATHRSILDTVIEGIITINYKGIIETVNPAVERIFGYSKEELLGQNVKMLMPNRYAKEHDSYLANYLATGKANIIGIGRELQATKKDGTEFPIDLGISRSSGEGQIFFTGIVRDISERKKIETMKNEFISTVSHELRTPLTSILGSLGLINAGSVGELPDNLRTMLNIAHKNTERLVRLINDILDVEKIESGKMTFALSPTLISDAAVAAIETNRGLEHQDNVRICLEQTLPEAYVNVDYDRLIQVFTNLISNAVKFSPPNDVVSISVNRHNDRIRVSVADNGPGIPAEFEDRIFGKFLQVDSSDSRQKGGTGLGLNISQKIISEFGGVLDFTTQEGVGTTFFFDLPEWHDPHVHPETPAFKNAQSRILVFETGQTKNLKLGDALGQLDFDVEIACSLEEVKEHITKHKYSAVVVSCQRSNAATLSLLREIYDEERNIRLPIILINSDSNTDTTGLTGEAICIVDCIDLSQGAIDKERMLDALTTVLDFRAKDKPRVLHIEDDFDTFTIINRVLKDIVHVCNASSLEEAKHKLKEEPFDLIILDLNLPDGLGYDILPYISKPNGASIPVIIFSAEDNIQTTQYVVESQLTKSRHSHQDLAKEVKRLIQQLNKEGD